MAIPSRQIGWSTKSNLLWQISKQLEYLTKVTANCCSTTTTTTTVACINTVWEYIITQEMIDNATGNTGIVITVNGTSYDTGNQTQDSQYSACHSSGGGGGNMSVQTVTLCANEEPYAWYYKDNAAVFIPVVDTLVPCSD